MGFGLVILIAIVIGALVLKLMKEPHPGRTENSDRLDSLMILKVRFAKGEISEDEYRKMKEILSD